MEREVISVGKPETYAFDLIELEHYKKAFAKKETFLMIGDNIFTDILFGKNVGIDTALVLTGVTHINDYHDIQNVERIKPSYVLVSISDIL